MYLQLERALVMVSKGHITLQMIQAFEGKISVPKTPLKMNEHSGKESTMAFAFSEQNWGVATRKLTEQVKKRTIGQISTIIEEARQAPTNLGNKREVATFSAFSGESSNRYAEICKSYCTVIHPLLIVIVSHF